MQKYPAYFSVFTYILLIRTLIFSIIPVCQRISYKGGRTMKEIKYCPPKKNGGNDGSSEPVKPTPEIILPPPTNATNVIPDEVPRRDGPGGE